MELNNAQAPRPLHVYRSFEALIDAVGEIGRGNRRYELNDLFLIEVLAESLDILLVNPARIPGQFFREVDGSLLLGFEHRTLPAGWIFQCCDLLFADALPPRRSGMCARSIGASIKNRRPQIRKFLRNRRQLTLAPDFLIKVQKCLQYFWLISQHLEKIDYLSTFFESLVNGNSRAADLLLFQRRYAHRYLPHNRRHSKPVTARNVELILRIEARRRARMVSFTTSCFFLRFGSTPTSFGKFGFPTCKTGALPAELQAGRFLLLFLIIYELVTRLVLSNVAKT